MGFFLSNYYVLFTCSFVLSYLILFYFIFDFFRYARAYVRIGRYTSVKCFEVSFVASSMLLFEVFIADLNFVQSVVVTKNENSRSVGF